MHEMIEETKSSSSYDSDYFDLEQMKQDFEESVEADNRYWRENNAKFRAVHQKVASYEEFRDIVLAAHLKPLDKSDKIKEKFQQPWNTLVHQTQTEKKQSSATQSVKLQKEDDVIIPKSSNEFVVEWRRLKDSSQKQCQLLLAIGIAKLSEFFKLEVAHGLLGQIIKVLDLYQADIKTEDVLAILDVLSTSQRFLLCLLFLTPQEKENCKNLFQNLKKELKDSDNSILLNKLQKLEKTFSEIL